MDRRINPRLEALEGRALLADLAVSLSLGSPGTPVVMTLTETNTSDHDVRVAEGCGVSDFWVDQGGVEVWRKSKDGPQPLCPISLNGDLHPHESRTFMAAWDGRFIEGIPPSPSGPFVAHAAVDGVGTPPVTIGVDAPPVSSPLAVHVATDRASYRVGQPVRATIVETNSGTVPVAVGVCGPDRVVISRRGIEVWRLRTPQVCPALAMLLQPGASRSVSVVWHGGTRGLHASPKAGQFSVQVSLDGVAGSATFTIGRRGSLR